MKRKTTKKKPKTPTFRKGVRKGQTRPRKVAGFGVVYWKSGKMHKTSRSRDQKIKAKKKITKNQQSWRGDVNRKKGL